MIDVMYNFSFFKEPTKKGFYYQSVFQNISRFCGVWMVWPVKVFVPSTYKITTVPFRVMPSSFRAAFFGTMNLMSRRKCVKHFIAGWANMFYLSTFPVRIIGTFLIFHRIIIDIAGD